METFIIATQTHRVITWRSQQLKNALDLYDTSEFRGMHMSHKYALDYLN